MNKHSRGRYRKLVTTAWLVVFLLLITNVAVFAVYQHRTYPRTAVMGVTVGNTPFLQLANKLSGAHPLPASLAFVNGSRHARISITTLGVTFDRRLAQQHGGDGRSWFPLLDFFVHHDIPAPIKFDQSKLATAAKLLTPTFYTAPKSTYIAYHRNQFLVADAQTGSTLDANKLQAAIMHSLTVDNTQVAVPLKKVASSISLGHDAAAKALAAVQSQLKTNITFSYLGKTLAAQPQDRADWFMQSGSSFIVSPTAVHAFVNQAGSKLFGSTPYNAASATSATIAAMQNSKDATISLQKFARTKTYTYCTAVRGVNASYLSSVNQLIDSVYANPRGWSMGGRITFKRVSSGCSFTVWLSSSAQMHTFGAICDSTWDCNIGTNVVANFDRWEQATSSWNAAHPAGALTDYRTLLINHETGHQLGFYDNYVCSAPGKLAPVMMQQSIDLHGCKFNPWPLASEQAILRARLGL